ncbi:hypothetical protein OROMI_011706 [Orobanche minor]
MSLLLSKAVEMEMIEAMKVGRDKITDDEVFTCLGKLDNVFAIKDILRNFELLSGLKVSSNWCSVMVLNMGYESLSIMAEILDCEVGIPLCYLGLNRE